MAKKKVVKRKKTVLNPSALWGAWSWQGGSRRYMLGGDVQAVLCRYYSENRVRQCFIIGGIVRYQEVLRSLRWRFGLLCGRDARVPISCFRVV